MENISSPDRQPSRAFLVGIQTDSAHDAQASLSELKSLSENLGYLIAGSQTAILRKPQPDLLLGSGTSQNICAMAQEAGADTIIFDTELSPSQQRNWDEASGCAILDRPGIIIGIFATRARTREAQLQVELAQLRYELPRLAFSYSNLSRQRGGFFGNKGSGEKKIELDRRRIRDQLHGLKEELDQVMAQRHLQRKNRMQRGTPVIALVGYTNAGKSSMHRVLAGSDVLVKDALFATLDPSARRFILPNTPECILVDTVGFVRNLPHSLIEAFKATLEEVNQADLIVQVLDASDPNVIQHHKTTMDVLAELDAQDIPRIMFLNKWDLVEKLAELQEQLDRIHLGAGIKGIRGSTVSLMGIEELKEALTQALGSHNRPVRFVIPYHRGDLKAALHRNSTIQNITEVEAGYSIEARPDERMRHALDQAGIYLEEL